MAFVTPLSFASGGCGNVPSSLIESCYPINITNTQSSATQVGFQQELTNLPFNALAGNFIVYNSISGQAIDSWVQSNSIAWINLGSNTIGAGASANGIYYLGLGKGTTNFFTTGITGEAPNLSVHITFELPSVWNNVTLLGLQNGIGGSLGPTFNGIQNVNGQEATIMWMNNSQLLGLSPSTKVFKMWWRSGSTIVYGESRNGYNWTMAPGNIIMNCATSPYTQGNSVATCNQPFVMFYNKTYYLYIGAENKSISGVGTNCLEDVFTSTNGLSWNIATVNSTNVCGKPNWISSGYLGNRYVFKDNTTGQWIKLQEAFNNTLNNWATGVFTSNSPTGVWTEYGTTPESGLSQSFGGPELHFINNTYYIWGQCNVGVSGTDPRASTDICMAYTSNIFADWSFSKYDPVFFRTPSLWWTNSSYNNSQVADPTMITLPNDTTYMYFETAYSQSIFQLAVAKSNLTLAGIIANGGQMNQSASIQKGGYGEYDTGSKVFKYYANFSGTTINQLSYGSNINLQQNNGLQVNLTTLNGGTIMTNWNVSAPYVFEADMTIQNSGAATNFQEGLISDARNNTGMNTAGNSLTGAYSTRLASAAGFYQINLGSLTLASSNPTNGYPYSSLENLTQIGNTIESYDNTYTLSSTNATKYSSGYLGYQLLYSTTTGKAMHIQYSLVRTPPPNDIMPTLSFSSAQYINVTISVSPSSIYINPGQSVNLVSSVNYGNGTYTYQWYNNNACNSAISGATSSSYTATPTNTTTYCVKVTSGTSTATALSTVNINNAATISGGGSSPTTLSISDNINIQSTVNVLNILLINPSTKAVISKNLYTQSQLPLTLTLSNEEAVFNFACSLTIGSTTYNYSNDIYGLGYGNTCGKNYTVYGGSYEIIYSPLTTSTTSTNTSTTSSTSSTSTITSLTTTPTINNNSIKNISLNSSNYIVISSKNTTTINSDQNAISLKLYNPNINSLSAVLILKNVTSSKTIPSINNKVLITAFSVNVSTTSNVSIYTNIHYSCNINSKTVAPYILQNNTWTPITPFSVNATSCSVLFLIPKDPIIALFSTNTNTKISNSTTTILSNVTTTQNNSSNNDLIYYVIIVIILIIVVWYLIIGKKSRLKEYSSK